MRTEIIPAILPRDFAEIEEKTALIKGFAKSLQIDICDGQFVQNATWPYRKDDDSFEKILKEELGMPSWQDFNYEFDLMVNKPEEKAMDWVIAGAARIIIHIGATGDVGKAIDLVGDKAEIGLALNIDTDLAAVEPYREKIQFIQLMGIDRIGFQHQAFDEKVVGRIKLARIKYPGLPISIDGGVSLETAPHLIAAGADRLVVGSAIFYAENPIDVVQRFKKL